MCFIALPPPHYFEELPSFHLQLITASKTGKGKVVSRNVAVILSLTVPQIHFLSHKKHSAEDFICPPSVPWNFDIRIYKMRVLFSSFL